MHYPYYLHFLNLLSFKYYGEVPSNIICPKPEDKCVPLWSITRVHAGPKTRSVKEHVAYYNCYTQNYEFCNKRYISYDDVVNEALKL